MANLASVTTGSEADSGADRVNWSIRLSDAEAGRWDDLVYALRKDTGRRTLSKADIVRALLDMALEDPAARKTLINVLSSHTTRTK
jgi:hypothetical protein